MRALFKSLHHAADSLMQGDCHQLDAAGEIPQLILGLHDPTAGQVAGLPVGISFFGRAYSEPTLIKIAYSFEQATEHRKPPRFLKTLA